MAFVDDVEIELRAGSGGDGVVRWRREKFVPKGGPAGGNGGRGGDVLLEATSDLTALARYRGQRVYEAERGQDGGSSQKHGRDGQDLVMTVPVGSFVTNVSTAATYDLTVPQQRVTVLRGGNGGRGNVEFKSSTNTTPEQSTRGRPGEHGLFRLELRLIADVGLVGLPNAGKSSILNELTRAHARVASYPFTTIEPNLGMLGDVVLADIPGLIEGAAQGRGLGTSFLRHIERTRIVCHCISLEHLDIRRAYDGVRRELAQYDRGLLDKPELIVLTKSDASDEGSVEHALASLPHGGRRPVVCSIYDYDSVKRLARALTMAVDELRVGVR